MKGALGYFLATSALTTPFISSANETISCEIVESRFWHNGGKINIAVDNLSTQSVSDWFVEITYPDDTTIVKHWRAEKNRHKPSVLFNN